MSSVLIEIIHLMKTINGTLIFTFNAFIRTIFLDALRMASSGGSIALLSKLVTNGDISQIDTILWLTLLPFTSYVEEESISSLIVSLKECLILMLSYSLKLYFVIMMNLHTR